MAEFYKMQVITMDVVIRKFRSVSVQAEASRKWGTEKSTSRFSAACKQQSGVFLSLQEHDEFDAMVSPVHEINTGYQPIGKVNFAEIRWGRRDDSALGTVTVNGQGAGRTEPGMLGREIPKRVALEFRQPGKFGDTE